MAKTERTRYLRNEVINPVLEQAENITRQSRIASRCRKALATLDFLDERGQDPDAANAGAAIDEITALVEDYNNHSITLPGEKVEILTTAASKQGQS